jgi:hypothetical protein
MIKNSYLSCAEEMGKSNPAVVHLKLEHTINIGDLEAAFVFSTRLLHQDCTDERVNSNKFQLDIISLIGDPFVALQLLNGDGVQYVLHDSVSCRSTFLSSLVVSHILDSDYTGLLKHPLAE